jgi:FtsZ-interacting cell division protein ZipA
MKFLQHGFGLIVVAAVLVLVIAIWRSRRTASSPETNSESFRHAQDTAEANRRTMEMARQAAETTARQSQLAAEQARRAAEAAMRNNLPR